MTIEERIAEFRRRRYVLSMILDEKGVSIANKDLLVEMGVIDQALEIIAALQEENQKLKEKLEIAEKGLSKLSEYANNHSDISGDARTMKKMATKYFNEINCCS